MSLRHNIEDAAAMWLSRKADESWNEADERALRDWLDESVAHAAAFWRLEHVWHALDRVSYEMPAPLAEAPMPDIGASRVWGRATWVAARRYGIGVAAALTTVAAGLMLVVYMHQPSPMKMESYSTQMGQIATVQLQDGSSISLNADSRVRVAQSDKERRMWLDRGEAYVEVARDQARPFTVLAGNGQVVVVGTKFMVSREGPEAEVAVLEGKVLLEQVGGGMTGHLTLTAGDVGRTRANTLLLTTVGMQRLRDQLAWQAGMVVFDDTPLEQAVAAFNRYNQRKIRLLSPKAREMRIGGSFKLGNIEGFVRLMSQAYKLDVAMTEDEITIR